ncbi:hypothetical protein [Cardiobacterium valvarum]|uniref:Uncharacterized protein n=1 Tax=Cardiobacterium valvarum F0432 TaxID=797473 RepID=G9ZG67_9GAMM|nr:hypothetical protein [Cardiobacterium valvarum]EHM53382.1 hypothetical protein HMPREF9080_01740 [Cardiobacterium valvarum F0432]
MSTSTNPFRPYDDEDLREIHAEEARLEARIAAITKLLDHAYPKFIGEVKTCPPRMGDRSWISSCEEEAMVANTTEAFIRNQGYEMTRTYIRRSLARDPVALHAEPEMAMRQAVMAVADELAAEAASFCWHKLAHEYASRYFDVLQDIDISQLDDYRVSLEREPPNAGSPGYFDMMTDDGPEIWLGRYRLPGDIELTLRFDNAGISVYSLSRADEVIYHQFSQRGIFFRGRYVMSTAEHKGFRAFENSLPQAVQFPHD